MAISNYSSVAFNHKGEPTGAQFKSEKYTLSVYKEWIHIRDNDLMENEKGYHDSVIGRVKRGKGFIGNIFFEVKRYRSTNNGCVCIAKTGFKHKNNLKGKVMLGVYAPEAEITAEDKEVITEHLVSNFDVTPKTYETFSQSFLGKQGSVEFRETTRTNN